MYIDRDHLFFMYQNEFVISPMCITYNKISKKITLDTNMREYSINDEMTLEYYRDMITRGYVLEEDCTITIKPVFRYNDTIGIHNVII